MGRNRCSCPAPCSRDWHIQRKTPQCLSYQLSVALLYSRIDLKYSSDWPLLLITMCSHIHQNHLALVESIKMKIRSTTLAEYKDNVTAYLRFLQDNLHLISPAGMDNKMHNDLIPHIFGQLRGTKIPIFQQQILKWQREYMENCLLLLWP